MVKRKQAGKKNEVMKQEKIDFEAIFCRKLKKYIG